PDFHRLAHHPASGRYNTAGGRESGGVRAVRGTISPASRSSRRIRPPLAAVSGTWQASSGEATMVRKLLVRRHSAVTRITHWVNVVALTVLLGSGLQIFNAHAALYWGQKSHFDRPWLSIGREQRDGEAIGVTRVGDLTLETTGLLGWTGR